MMFLYNTMQIGDSEGGDSLRIWATLRAANHDWYKYLTIDLYEEEVRRANTEANTGEPRHAGKKDWPPWCALISVNNVVKSVEKDKQQFAFQCIPTWLHYVTLSNLKAWS